MENPKLQLEVSKGTSFREGNTNRRQAKVCWVPTFHGRLQFGHPSLGSATILIEFACLLYGKMDFRRLQAPQDQSKPPKSYIPSFEGPNNPKCLIGLPPTSIVVHHCAPILDAFNFLAWLSTFSFLHGLPPPILGAFNRCKPTVLQLFTTFIPVSSNRVHFPNCQGTECTGESISVQRLARAHRPGNHGIPSPLRVYWGRDWHGLTDYPPKIGDWHGSNWLKHTNLWFNDHRYWQNCGFNMISPTNLTDLQCDLWSNHIVSLHWKMIYTSGCKTSYIYIRLSLSCVGIWYDMM